MIPLPFSFLSKVILVFIILFNPNATSSGNFGYKVKMSNDGLSMLVSTLAEAGTTRRVDYYKRTTGTNIWAYQFKIDSTDINFGSCLGINADGHYFVIGATDKVNTYTYTGGSTYTAQTPITGIVGNTFGKSCDLSAGLTTPTLAVGDTLYDRSGGWGNDGAIYIYNSSNGTYTFKQILQNTASISPNNQFGSNVSIGPTGSEVGASAVGSTKPMQIFFYLNTDTNWYIDFTVAMSYPGKISIGAGNNIALGNNNNIEIYRYTTAWSLSKTIAFTARPNSIYFTDATATTVGQYLIVGFVDCSTNGCVQIFYENPINTWINKKQLESPDLTNGRSYGYDVTGNKNASYFSVGAPSNNSSGVNNSGAVYVYDMSKI